MRKLIDYFQQILNKAMQTLLAPQLSNFYSLEGELLGQDQVEDMLEGSEAHIVANRTTPHQEVDEVMKSLKKVRSHY